MDQWETVWVTVNGRLVKLERSGRLSDPVGCFVLLLVGILAVVGIWMIAR